jgi:hypothetical protein
MLTGAAIVGVGGALLVGLGLRRTEREVVVPAPALVEDAHPFRNEALAAS